MTDNNSDSIGQGLGAIPGSRERGQEVVPALTGFDPARRWGPRIVAKLQTPCLPWDLRDRSALHPIGERCADCGGDVAVAHDFAGFDPVCIYCAIDSGLLPTEEIEPGDERTLHAIAMEAATAGETCNRLDPKDDSAGPQGHRPETGGQ